MESRGQPTAQEYRHAAAHHKHTQVHMQQKEREKRKEERGDHQKSLCHSL